MWRAKNVWWRTFWIGVLASLLATLLWAMFAGSSASRVRFRMEFERAPATTEAK